MKKIITLGQWRGLKTTSTSQHVFTILAFDQRGSYRKMLPEGASYDTAAQIKQEVVTALSFHTSAVLLDPVFGLQAVLRMAGSSGLLMSLEKTGYSGDANYRGLAFNEAWTVEKIRRMGASAVKLLVYYHPETGALAEELEETIRQVALDCQHHDIPLFLEPVSYSLDAAVNKTSKTFAMTRPDVVRETARRLGGLGASVLKLEFPVDAAFNHDQTLWRDACQAVSDVCEIPWVLLSAGVDFSTFEQQAKVACESRASGFLAGRAIWKESVAMAPDQRQHFLEHTAIERTRRLSEIANSLARPWTDLYDAPPDQEEWFKSYKELA